MAGISVIPQILAVIWPLIKKQFYHSSKLRSPKNGQNLSHITKTTRRANSFPREQIEEELYQDEDLKKRVLNNPIDNFKYAFVEVFINKMIERMDSNQEIFDKIMENTEFKNDVKDWLTKKIYQRFNDSKE